MLTFFDYIYYKVCKAYASVKDSGPEFTAACVVALMQYLNFFSCFELIELIKHDKTILNKFIVIIGMAFFLVFNYIRYVYSEKNNYDVLKTRFEDELNSYRKGVLVTIYIIVSTVLAVGLAIYIGSKKW
jgi:hypothetical protein